MPLNFAAHTVSKKAYQYMAFYVLEALDMGIKQASTCDTKKIISFYITIVGHKTIHLKIFLNTKYTKVNL